MHPHISKLHDLSAKESRLILGLMSGTSLDGLDIALCKITGQGKHTKCEVIRFVTVDYCDDYRNNIKQIFAKSHGSIEHLCLLNAWVGRYHAKLINQTLADFGYVAADIDVVASHGQTVYHSPSDQHGLADFGNATLQIGDGDHIAVLTNIITLSDFRQKHIAAGGQGAPLVMYGDYLLFSSECENRVMLNIGGIANLSFLPQDGDISTVFSSDIGPGNTIMDAYVQRHFEDMHYDKDAELARRGKPSQALLTALLNDAFFAQAFPKTTGPEVFNLAYLKRALIAAQCEHISIEDVLSTLCEFSAQCIVNSILKICDELPAVMIYASGGGIHNPLLMERIRHKLNCKLPQASMGSTDLLALNPDAKEAVLFALLANETLCSDGNTFTSTQSNMPSVTMGKISFPD
jgi:anhydro-N-acetylmuramic acid kinase